LAPPFVRLGTFRLLGLGLRLLRRLGLLFGLLFGGLGRLLLQRSLLFRRSLFLRGLLLLGRLVSRRSRIGLRLIQQLHQCHWRVVARTLVHAQDAGIAARTRFESRAEVLKQLHDYFRIAQLRKRTAAIRIRIVLAERDQRLDDTAQFFRLRQSGTNGFMTQQGCRHIAEHCRAMRCIATELPAGELVTHKFRLLNLRGFQAPDFARSTLWQSGTQQPVAY
jgi:hypothetical protein